MATLGDPLADLGLYLLYYVRDDAQTGNVGATISPEAGFLPRDDVVERYAKQSGRDVSQLDFYEALAAYKLAIILEGIHARFLMGKTVGEGFDHIGSLVEIMVQGALDQCSRRRSRHSAAEAPNGTSITWRTPRSARAARRHLGRRPQLPRPRGGDRPTVAGTRRRCS